MSKTDSLYVYVLWHGGVSHHFKVISRLKAISDLGHDKESDENEEE